MFSKLQSAGFHVEFIDLKENPVNPTIQDIFNETTQATVTHLIYLGKTQVAYVTDRGISFEIDKGGETISTDNGQGFLEPIEESEAEEMITNFLL